MAEAGIWKSVLVILIYVMSLNGELICKSRYSILHCKPGKNDYILKRGIVSDNNDTNSIIIKLCRITEVELESFANNPRLKVIDLSRNKIIELKLGVFDGIKTLTHLKIAHNLLTAIPLGLFDHLPNLKLLHLNDNIEAGIFDKLSYLFHFDLSGNGLSGKDLNPTLFDKKPKLKSLLFSRNDMSQSPDELLSGLPALTTLELNACSLTTFPNFATKPNLKTLLYLQLNTNKIDKIDDVSTFANLINLESLDLKNNRMENITVTVFSSLRNLNFLEMSFNRIQKIPEDLFRSMPNLQSMDLSYNFIEYVPLNALLPRSNLRTLKLASNRISFLESGFFKKLRFSRRAILTDFDIAGNPFQCACLLEIIDEMKKYSFRYNSDKYNGKHEVCSMTDEFICKRDKLSV